MIIDGSKTQRVRGRAAQRNRERILRRDNGLCQACLRSGHVKIGHEVDHIIGLEQGGSDDDSNKELLCHDCHTDKTARDNGKRTKTRYGPDGLPIGPGTYKPIAPELDHINPLSQGGEHSFG